MKSFFVLFFLFKTTVSFAQADGFSHDENQSRQNEVKANFLAFAFKSVSVQYERQISRSTTIAIDLRVMPRTNLPFKSGFKNLLTDTATANQIDNFRTGNMAIMPSVRFYTGRKGAYEGFYIAPFASFAHYAADLPYRYYDSEYKIIPLSGSLSAFTAGIMFGAQWNLSKSVYFDWWMFGPHYGFSKGKANGQKSLTQSEQDALKNALDNLDIPLTRTSNIVDATGAIVHFSGPWAGIRAGLCIGIRF